MTTTQSKPAKPLLRKLAAESFNKTNLWSSALGQKLGWEWLIYNPLVIYSFERAARRNAPKMADAVLAEFPAIRSIADIGCGGGGFAAEFQKRGLRVVGCEYGEAGRNRAAKKGVEVHEFDLSKSQTPLPGSPFDLAISLEVGEHIPAELASAFAGYLTCTSDLIVFTAAQPGQGGHGHINEQPCSYWIEKFAQLNFLEDAPACSRISASLRRADAFPYLINNLLVFRRERPD